jgi:GalNAc5-diNAcBac-PP-undecaprenol beta-1,3-glucosyltransferase
MSIPLETHSVSTNPEPFITVITPTHLRAKLLKRCLTSVKNQTAKIALEHIVVSDVVDLETDLVCSELLGPTDTYVRRSGKCGPAASRNLALAIARGQYVLFLDDDDCWQTDFLGRLTAELLVRAGRFVYCNATVVYESRPADGPQEISRSALDLSGQLTPLVYVRNQVHMSCYAFPRRVLLGLQFDESLRAYEDWDFILAVLGREIPTHVAVNASLIYEVRDSTTDRRGSSSPAKGISGALDYLYVYRRHPAPTPDLKKIRGDFIRSMGVEVPSEFF